MTHIVCYSGGHSSGIVAIEVVRRFGKENVILLNHDISPRMEGEDIKRFKKEVSEYLDVPITYANIDGLKVDEIPDQFDVVEKAGSFINIHTREALCTNRLKTKPFYTFLEKKFSNKQAIIYYGFDADELKRVDRRKGILNDMGFSSDYPLALWGEGRFSKLEQWYTDQGKDFNSIIVFEGYENKDSYKRTIFSTKEIGIEPPNTYSIFKHANCIGCLKARKRHWYCVYVHDKEVFDRGKLSEKRIGHTIIKGESLESLEPLFEKMKKAGVPANEHGKYQTFWAKAKKFLKSLDENEMPCECSF
jgi:hypothetical protein